MNIFELEKVLNDKLRASEIKDYAPNGLQVEGKHTVKKIVTGVTASLKLIDRAIEKQADLILVHHGYFWKNEDPRIINMKYQRIAKLIKHDINLMGYHLPLDVSMELGNNILLGKMFNIENIAHLEEGDNLVLTGNLASPMTGDAFARLIEEKLHREPLHIAPESDKLIHTVAWCSGGAQDYIDLVAQYNVDAYITGEVSERTTHSAREQDLHFYGAGHHATECCGIEALGNWLAKEYSLDVEFVDCDNPV